MQRILYALVAALLPSLIANSQNFNYTFSADSVGWQELTSQTIKNTSNSAWNFAYRIPIGFTYNYLGRNFDSLTIETNGYLVFDNDRYYEFTAFLGLADCVDSNGTHSVLSYNISGSSGNHILKIQYKNLSNQYNAVKFFSYQIWLKESNRAIEVHIGPNDFQPVVVDSVLQVDSSMFYRVGILNANMDLEDNGLFIEGDPRNPTSVPCNTQNPETAFLILPPVPGYRYVFTPNF